ncbi:MAG TPA: BTAD domain-containing putative transcriptional regulator [Streptosporangiaceae bacterium]|jgi:DNA-binding SARP family transcriptional activator
MIEIEILHGEFIVRCNSLMITLQPMQATLIFALLSAGGPVESGRLAELLWGVVTEGSAATLRTHVKRVRAKAANAGAPPGRFIICDRAGNGRYVYKLPEGIRYDVTRFRALADSGAIAYGRGEYRQAAGHLTAALTLWSAVTSEDQILAAVADRPFVVKIRRDLWEARQDLIICKARTDIVLGLDRQVAASLAPLAEHWPADREIATLRADALYNSGQPQQAAEVLRLAVVAARETGLDPATSPRCSKRSWPAPGRGDGRSPPDACGTESAGPTRHGRLTHCCTWQYPSGSCASRPEPTVAGTPAASSTMTVCQIVSP